MDRQGEGVGQKTRKKHLGGRGSGQKPSGHFLTELAGLASVWAQKFSFDEFVNFPSKIVVILSTFQHLSLKICPKLEYIATNVVILNTKNLRSR